ncbi:MAG TPA: exodeoxyribonuclease VII large subunit [Xanthobacteraceae bacterium]|nr:exodeoxyribonuclease VII large subunit [Xanthobacteraceae bacterium]
MASPRAAAATIDPPRGNLIEISVSELSASLKRAIEDGFGHVRVRGELGNVKYHSSGHIYLDLKDDRACLAGVVWRSAAPRIKVKLEAGLEVVVTGRITTFPGQSKYQIVIETLEPAGLGALMALVEERRRKLTAEGLFDPARKQLLPLLPDVIGVVTSPTGAVIRDILHRLEDRFPRHVLVWPVRVQGDGSAEQVAAAIHGFNALPQDGPIPRPDIIIVARGGGSLEDLWSFNDEAVVRAAADSMIPLISAIGHETDVTLIDFAADQRAPTPTAAAEMAVPVRADLLAEIDSLARRARTCWLRGMEARRTELRAASRALPSAEGLLAIPRQRLDAASDRLPRALVANAQGHHRAYERIAARLTPAQMQRLVAQRSERLASLATRLNSSVRANANAHATRIANARERIEGLGARSRRAMMQTVEARKLHIARTGQLLTALSYQGVLARGFALVRDAEGHPVQRAAAVTPGMGLQIEFGDGRVNARAEGGDTSPPVGPAATPASKPRQRKAAAASSDAPAKQGSLFGN